ncbi:SMC-Scp complex subunit ScpB [Xylanibacillus composti]|uniref:Segregation and condensation protein B n=1 Tax=Xylanibacillus composti TaxID=1572762 RepID=A0A8J4H5T8_9BACL|nr:SMC-Scp complex subunit ScpB [Xylanibacillus composti]MDT9726684.1 SMC-Scp complex subunit ScpB [Xylanibacillus composti]GIQ69384.1 segregation and condensation protein B [Xylanibacillus composti]
MEYPQMKSIIEGLLFAAGDEGLDAKQIAAVLEQSANLVEDLLHDLQSDYRREQRGIQIMEIAGVFQMTTLPEHAVYFQKLAASPTRASLSQAALEVLSIIAYRQPITRVDVEEIRGVKSDRAIQTLVAKNLIKEVARADVIGRPILYGTTKLFLDYFGLKSLNELPNAEEFDSDSLLEEETRLLFEKLDAKQMTIDDVDGDEARSRAAAELDIQDNQ